MLTILSRNPPERHELIARIHSLVKVKQLDGNLTDLGNVLLSLASTVEAKDSYTSGHTERVAALASEIGRRLELPGGDIQALRLGGILHDIGKIGVSETILNKSDPLDEDDWNVIRSHPDVGYRICLPLAQSIGSALDIIRHHHEKLDGSSYPDGLAGDEISLVARIMAVVDIYDALTTDRPYRNAMPEEKALAILDEEVESGKIDAMIVAEMHALVMSEIRSGRRADDDRCLGQKNILVIEDDMLNLKLVNAIFHDTEYNILGETNAHDGIETAKREKPVLILMDIQLPRIDGVAATRLLKSDPEIQNIPVIAMSAHAMSHNIREALEAGCVDYITKPVRKEALLSIVEKALKKGEELQRLRPFLVNHAMVLNSAGLVLYHKNLNPMVALDEDLFGGMFTAIKMFISDSLSADGELKNITHDNYNIMLEDGSNFFLAVIGEGEDTHVFRRKMGALVRQIEEEYGTEIETWDGDMDVFEGLDVMFSELI